MSVATQVPAAVPAPRFAALKNNPGKVAIVTGSLTAATAGAGAALFITSIAATAGIALMAFAGLALIFAIYNTVKFARQAKVLPTLAQLPTPAPLPTLMAPAPLPTLMAPAPLPMLMAPQPGSEETPLDRTPYCK